MDKETKQALATILSEIYELKNQMSRVLKEESQHDEFIIEALKNKYEVIINEEFGIHNNKFKFRLKESRYNKILTCLNEYISENPEVIENLTGFYDFPSKMRERFSETEWNSAFRIMKHKHLFNEIISKIEGSPNSPAGFDNW